MAGTYPGFVALDSLFHAECSGSTWSQTRGEGVHHRYYSAAQQLQQTENIWKLVLVCITTERSKSFRQTVLNGCNNLHLILYPCGNFFFAVDSVTV